jgi:hypothetical protein
MVIGGVGLVLSIAFWSGWGGFSFVHTRSDEETTVVERRP